MGYAVALFGSLSGFRAARILNLGQSGIAVMLCRVNARVLIDGPSELVFDYAVPAGMAVREGCRVRIPLRRKSASGTVLALVEGEVADFAMREVEALLDP